MDDGSVIVTVFPDNGVKYLSKIFNDSWLESKGLEAAAEGNGAVSEDVETKPIVTKVTWKAGVTPPNGVKPHTVKTTSKRQAPPRTPPRQQQAALDETHLTLETDSAPPTPADTSAATSSYMSAERLAELESHRVAAGEMAAAMAARDDTIAALERELRAALDREVESRSKPPPSAEPSLAGEEAADRVAARLAKAETALGKERAAAEEARASLARERETAAAETQRLRDSETRLRARAESAETQLAAAAAELAAAAAAAETAMASERAAKAEAATDGAATGAQKTDDVEARVAAAEKVCEKLMADNQDLVTRVNAQAVELDRLRALDFRDVDVAAAGAETAAPGSQTMRPNGGSEGGKAHVEEWERRRSRGIWGFISGADRFVPPDPKRAASEGAANAGRPEE